VILRLFELCVVAAFGVLVGLVTKESQLSAALRPDEYLTALQRIVCPGGRGDRRTPVENGIEEREKELFPVPGERSLQTVESSPRTEPLLPEPPAADESVSGGSAEPLPSYEEEKVYFVSESLREDSGPLSQPSPPEPPPPDDEGGEPPPETDGREVDRLLELMRRGRAF